MEYFTEQATSHSEALNRIRQKYGERAKILNHRTIRMGGFLGMFRREGIEISGYISNELQRRKQFDLEEEKKKILNTVKSDVSMSQVLKALDGINQKLDTKLTGDPPDADHESIIKIRNLLSENEFAFSFIQDILDRLKRELALDDLENYHIVQDSVARWISEKISIYTPQEFPKTMILVGPTGVGKTTTIAKLAAIYGLNTEGKNSKSVRMITIDNYRIGAKKQIETYGEIMNIPVDCVETYQDLQKKITLYDGVDLVLIDTIGKSPRDYVKLAEMREMLDAAGNRAEVFLAMSATTKASDVKEILRQFEPFKYNAVIMTKLDETMRIGNIISALSEKGKPFAFITDGQNVPQDIEEATVSRLMKQIEGLKASTLSLAR
ncbi:MAG: flagellar biosynthesis protein FlhF [Spirochaetales bacterium]|nr:flagellar biosynthesis protein FlhF [Spirochaetales bacterium]